MLRGLGDAAAARAAWREALAVLDDLDDPAVGDLRARLAGTRGAG